MNIVKLENFILNFGIFEMKIILDDINVHNNFC